MWDALKPWYDTINKLLGMCCVTYWDLDWGRFRTGCHGYRYCRIKLAFIFCFYVITCRLISRQIDNLINVHLDIRFCNLSVGKRIVFAQPAGKRSISVNEHKIWAVLDQVLHAGKWERLQLQGKLHKFSPWWGEGCWCKMLIVWKWIRVLDRRDDVWQLNSGHMRSSLSLFSGTLYIHWYYCY